MAHLEEKAELIQVTNDYPDTVATFLSLGRDYLSDLSSDERERFLRSILTRQSESDRWLLLLKYEGEYLGFIHMKIDRHERPGWGFILEFYIVPNKRRVGWGRRLFNLTVEILRARGVKSIYLLSTPTSEQFWYKLGFAGTGEIDKETCQKVLVTSI